MESFNMEMLPIRVFMYLDNVPISSYIYNYIMHYIYDWLIIMYIWLYGYVLYILI